MPISLIVRLLPEPRNAAAVLAAVPIAWLLLHCSPPNRNGGRDSTTAPRMEIRQPAAPRYLQIQVSSVRQLQSKATVSNS